AAGLLAPAILARAGWLGRTRLRQAFGLARKPRRGATANHGAARWMDMAEARERFPGPDPDVGGVVVGEAARLDLGEAPGAAALLVDPCREGPTHSIVLAGSGAFKTTSLVATLLIWRKSRVVMDPSAELGPMLEGVLSDMGQQVVQLRVGDGSGFNVLAAIDTDEPLAEMKVRAVAQRVVGPLPSRADDNAQRWKAAGRDIVTALLAHMMWDDTVPPEEKTLRRLRRGVALPEPELRDVLAGIHATSNSPMARDVAGTLMNLVPETFSGAYFNATGDTAWLSADAYAEMVSGDAFDARDLARGDLSVFLQVPLDALKETPAVARVVVGSLLDAVMAADGVVDGRVLFAIDEAVLLGPLAALQVARDQGRKYRITLQLFYQSEGQVEEVWGRPGRESWFDGVSWRAYGGVQSLATAKDLSAALGTFGAVAVSRGSNSGTSARGLELGSRSRGSNLNEHEIGRELAKPFEVLQEIARDERIVLIPAGRPLRCAAAVYFRRPALRALVAENRFAPAVAGGAP
ncbi:MAG: type IV secretory system conjugative DNA transfer family protein, partial [Acetobacteraceae bacterium]|nr:type IV secretory system conjugative DNA transfer family protein [Acetobacteraceae bacterium]